MDTGFAAGQQGWIDRLDTLRNIVRQELVTRQLRAELPTSPQRVLDVGCGQGTQALELARRGYEVTGLDSSPELLDRLRKAKADQPVDVQGRLQVLHADIPTAWRQIPRNSYDIVLCHGVLMYFPDPQPVLDLIAHAIGDHGLVSLLVRNGDALAMRPGLQGQWAAADQAFESSTYLNRHGVHARADRLDDLRSALAERGLRVRNWYGVRTFTDVIPSAAAIPGDTELQELLAAEERAGRTDPYRGVSGLLHIIGSADRRAS